MIEVCTLHKDGTIHLTKEELETMLNKAYNEGKKNAPVYYPVYYHYTSPYYTSPTYTYTTGTQPLTDGYTVTCKMEG